MRRAPVARPIRETQVCELLLLGYDTAGMAKEMKITPRTVKAHLHSLYKRYKILDGYKRIKLAILLTQEKFEQEKEQQA